VIKPRLINLSQKSWQATKTSEVKTGETRKNCFRGAVNKCAFL